MFNYNSAVNNNQAEVDMRFGDCDARAVRRLLIPVNMGAHCLVFVRIHNSYISSNRFAPQRHTSTQLVT